MPSIWLILKLGIYLESIYIAPTLLIKGVCLVTVFECVNVRHLHDTNTCGYIQLFYFLRLLGV
jgi:uncharacterized membrane protein YhaH (DUF805 family)